MSESLHAIVGKLDVAALQPKSSTDRVAECLVIVDHHYPGRHRTPVSVMVATNTRTSSSGACGVVLRA